MPPLPDGSACTGIADRGDAGLVTLATLTPSLVVYGGTIAMAHFGGRFLLAEDNPTLRRLIAVALGTMAIWIARG